ncbi:MAG: hypothetical protein MUO26_08850, partial [Methanotrichaceae archaeon]|nr:hypothetical protein [Methanotrichaceae archaeon]
NREENGFEIRNIINDTYDIYDGCLKPTIIIQIPTMIVNPKGNSHIPIDSNPFGIVARTTAPMITVPIPIQITPNLAEKGVARVPMPTSIAANSNSGESIGMEIIMTCDLLIKFL